MTNVKQTIIDETTTTNQCASNTVAKYNHTDKDNNTMSIKNHKGTTIIDNKVVDTASTHCLDETSLFQLKEKEGEMRNSQTENASLNDKGQQDSKEETKDSSSQRKTTDTTTDTTIIVKTETNEFKPIHHPSNFPMIMPSSSSSSTNKPSNTRSKESNNNNNNNNNTNNSTSKLGDQTTNDDTNHKSCNNNNNNDDNDNVVQKNEVEGLQPNLYDVLCGRGGVTNNHVGNKRFRSLVATYQPLYLTCRKVEKSIVAKNIVDIVHQYGGRFLKKQGRRGNFFWTEADMKKAIEKTSQALREGLDVRQNKTSFYKHVQPPPPPTTTTTTTIHTQKQNNPEFYTKQQPQFKQRLVKIQHHHDTNFNDQVRRVHMDHGEKAKQHQLKQHLRQLHEQHKQNHLQQKTEVLVSTTRKRMKKKLMSDGTTRVYVTDDTG